MSQAPLEQSQALLAKQVLTLITQKPNINIISPTKNNETVKLFQLEKQLNIIAATDTHLTVEDFAHVISTLSEHNKPTELDSNSFFSLIILNKINVISKQLNHSEAKTHIEQRLNILNRAMVFAPAQTANKKAPRRRASLHRANLQLNKKRTATTSTTSTVNCLNQFTQDLQQWDKSIVSHFMETGCALLQLAPDDFNRAIERLIAIAHHFRLLLQNHLKRLDVWLFEQLQAKHISLAKEDISSIQAVECFKQLSQSAQTFNQQYQAYQQSQPSHCNLTAEQVSYNNYLISRMQLQLLLTQPKLIHNTPPLLTNRAFVLFEPNYQLTDKLCHILNLQQKLIDLFWYDVCHLSESICKLETEQFNHQTLQCFYKAQSFKNHIVNINVSIESLANQLHFTIDELLNALSRVQHHLTELIHYQGQAFAHSTAMIGKITIHHSEQGQFAQLTQVKYASITIKIIETFDDIVASINYQQNNGLDHMQLAQIHKHVQINLDTLNQSMETGYKNWLQLLNLLRDNDFKSPEGLPPKPAVEYSQANRC